MQKLLVDAKWDWCDKRHIRLDFSDNINSVSKFKIIKIFILFRIMVQLLLVRCRGRIDVTYYPPAGPLKVPFYRDIVLLFIVKNISNKVVFHFHAGGFDQLNGRLNFIEKSIALKLYKEPDLAITLLPSLNNEIEWITPLRTVSIPNGIIDVYNTNTRKKNKLDITVLFVGNLVEKKGIEYLVQAYRLINNKKIKLKIIGGWRDFNLRKSIENEISKNRLNGRIEFLGVKEEEAKWKYFYEADIFCAPTFENEAQPLILIEAMMMELPIITTNWRSIPDIITDGKEGYLVPIRCSEAIAEKINILAENPYLRLEMGKNGREKYLKKFTLEKHLSNMESVFINLFKTS